MKEVKVPCDGCTACCRMDAIELLPKHGDDIMQFQTELVVGRFFLSHKPNGDCVYLAADGCSIYERRPHQCRTYDCRKVMAMFGPRDSKRQRAAIANGLRLDILEASRRIGGAA